MLDVSISYNRHKFLGHEFLTWLWYAIDSGETQLQKGQQGGVSLEIGNRLVLENKKEDRSERITITGDDAGLEEGLLALHKGAVVTEMNLCYKADEADWRFTIKAESLHVGSLKCPTTATIETPEDLEGAILEKAYLCEKAFAVIDALFKEFVKVRISEKWPQKIVPQIKTWTRRQQ